MADKPIIVDYETKLCSAILQPLFDMVWDGLGESPVPVDVRGFIGAVEEAPSDGNPYTRLNAGWQQLTPALVNIQWGDIGGTLSNQADLQAALDLKATITYVDAQDQALQTQITANANAIAALDAAKADISYVDAQNAAQDETLIGLIIALG